jgi:hypothetical protein
MLTLNSASVFTGLPYYSNDGQMKNTGYEVEINTRIINSKVKWDLGVGLAHYKNEITKLPEDNAVTEIADANIISKVGKQTGLFYGYKTKGVFSTDQEAAASGLYIDNKDGSTSSFRGGDMHFVDNVPDGNINASDMVIIGNPNPKYTGMLTSNIKWNRLELNMIFTCSLGNDVYNYQRRISESMQNFDNQSTAVLNRWQTNGQVTNMPRAEYGDPMGNSRFSDRWIENGSYLKLKSLSLSYDIPFKPGFFKNASVYITGINLLTFTKYLGRDPEFNLDQSPLAQGIDYGYTPVYKAFLFGFKIGL